MRQKLKALEDALAKLKQDMIQQQAGIDENKRSIDRVGYRVDKCDTAITNILQQLRELRG